MENTSVERLKGIARTQREYFRSGATLEIDFRKRMLSRLMEALEAWQDRLSQALWDDLHKSPQEAYLMEFGIIKEEIKTHLKNLSKWAARKKVHSPVTVFPSKSYIIKEPLGCALIISPWNYPVQLLMNPLIGAISAGCTAVLKPSPYVPNVSEAIGKMVSETFNEEYIAVVQGDREVNTALLEERWDMIFFTGSPALGRTVMSAAAKNLTPVVLELGGKSPCIIDRTADVKAAAKRVVWGKTINSGQTCIAPDYLIVHKDIKEAFIRAFAHAVFTLHGEDIFNSDHYVHMVNQKSHNRVCSYLSQGNIIYGGRTNPAARCIEPTLLDDVPEDAPVMQEEIFGPIFPIITFTDSPAEKNPSAEKSATGPTTAHGTCETPDTSEAPDTCEAQGISEAHGTCEAPGISEAPGTCKAPGTCAAESGTFAQQAVNYIVEREKPLALYYFGDEKTGWEIMKKTSSGGGCINDVIMHIANGDLPFGGVGNSGMGRYHHKESFECFSHTRSILVSYTWPDLPFRYMPYRFFKWVKGLM